MLTDIAYPTYSIKNPLLRETCLDLLPPFSLCLNAWRHTLKKHNMNIQIAATFKIINNYPKGSKMKYRFPLALLVTLTISLSLQTAQAADAADSTAKISILEPQNGATVPTTFTVKLGAAGIDIVPAGTPDPVDEHAAHHHDHSSVEHMNHDHSPHQLMGHIHLLADVDVLPTPGSPIPMNANFIHLMQGQTETQLTLPPGKHTLQLILGNSSHMAPAVPVVSKKITITVK